MNQEKNQFRLEIRKDGLSPMKIDVIDAVSVGHDPRNDLVIIGKKIQPKHLVFSVKGENLALTYCGLTNQTFLNNLPLEEGRTYLLEIGDKIEIEETTLTILKEHVSLHESQKIKPKIFESKKLFDDMTPEMVKEASLPPIQNEVKEKSRVYKIEETPSEEVQKKQFFDTARFFSLWRLKAYAILTDFFITYLVLSTLLPLILIDKYVQEILFYLTAYLFPQKENSYFSFLIAWYLISFTQTMIFGSTFGQFLVGLRHETGNSGFRLIFSRMKTFLFSLVLLPAQNSFKENLFYKGMRKVGLIVIFISILLAPFLLPAPFNTQLTLLEDTNTKKVLHTQTLESSSKTLNMSLAAEIPFRYKLLPIITGGLKKRAFQFVDLKENQSITIEEKMDFNYKELQTRLEYANPFYKLLRDKNLSDLYLENKKQIITHTLMLSPLELKNTISTLGPLFGSAVLLKSTLLNKSAANDIILKIYRPQTPVLYLTGAELDFFYLFEKDRLVRFQVMGKKNKALALAFEDIVASKLMELPENADEVSANKISILETQDAFISDDSKVVLAYYNQEAAVLKNTKVVFEDEDLTERSKIALKTNIESNLKFVTDKNLERSLVEIKNSLTQ